MSGGSSIDITPSLVREFESRIQGITTGDYARLSQNTWWQFVAKLRPTVTKKEVLTWLLETAMIRDSGKSGGKVSFEDLYATYTELETRHAGDSLRLTKDQMSDVYNGEPGGEAFSLGAAWAKQMAAQMAYWPQKKVAHLLKNGHTAAASGGYDAYDALPFFSAAHKLNPYDAAVGTYKNLWTGADAAPIGTAVTLDVAANNLSTIWGNIMSLKAANGEDPRGLMPRYLVVPPKMFPRAKQLTSADFIAQAASSGGGSADFRAFLEAMGVLTAVVAPELADFESDTSYFIVCEQHAADELGGVIYVEREPFRMSQYGELSSAELSRLKMLEWDVDGRNSVAGGHPYLIHKVKAA